MIKKLCDHEGDFETCDECQDNLKLLIEEKPLGELQIKRRILDRVIREGIAAGDPRTGEPIRQQKIIDLAITEKLARARREKGEPDPPDQVVGLKSLDLGTRSPGGGGS